MVFPVSGHSGNTALSFSIFRMSSIANFALFLSRVARTCTVLTRSPQYSTVSIVYRFSKGMTMARGGARKGSGRKSTGKVAMLVRVKPEVRARLERDAKRAKRSLSHEVELQLDALSAAPRPNAQMRAMLSRHADCRDRPRPSTDPPILSSAGAIIASILRRLSTRCCRFSNSSRRPAPSGDSRYRWSPLPSGWAAL